MTSHGAPAPDRVRQALEALQSLPTLPSLLLQILETASDPDASALDLGRWITADQSLAASVLRLVNSAYYGVPRQIDSVPRAIVMLGFVEVRNLVFAAGAFAALPRGAGAPDPERVWRHSLASAMACERLARRAGLAGQSGAYLAGLLHDVGKLALGVLFPREYAAAVESARDRDESLYEAESRAFGLDHARAGGLLAERWNLPVPVVEAIRDHHTALPDGCEPGLAQTVALADHIVYAADLGDPGNPLAPPLPEGARGLLDRGDVGCDALIGEIAEARDRIDDLLGAMRAR